MHTDLGKVEQMVEQDRLPQTLLFAGPEGVGKATLVWQAPQNRPSKMSTIEYFVAPRFTPVKISGWQPSQPDQMVCLACEKMMSGMPCSFAVSANDGRW